MKKVKKVAVVVLALALSMMLMAFAPAMAASPKKIPVTAVTFNQVNNTPETRTTNGGIIHTVFERTGNVRLTIDGQAPIVGTLSEVVHTMNNTKTGEAVGQNFDAVWTFAGGSFEGVKQTRISTVPTFSLDQHVVFQGSGIFEGQTLMLSQEAPPFPPTYTGFLLIH